VDVDPLCCKAAIEEMLPANLLLASDEVLEGVGVIGNVDVGCWPMLESQEEKTFGVIGAVPFVAMIANCVEELL